MSLAPISPSFPERILSRLARAEWREVNPHFQADYRIAWITVLRAARGELWPHVTATYAVLGLHPEKVWPAILARRRALLGHKSAEGLPPKKPARSEGSATWKLRSDRAA
jgi:hypothetical protein